jgi:hypothetical protein
MLVFLVAKRFFMMSMAMRMRGMSRIVLPMLAAARTP